MKLFICFAVLFIATLARAEQNLQDQTDEQIEPATHAEEDVLKDHSKRTIAFKNPGWAKHVGVHPQGHKYVLGYGPVDYKYVPVIKPLVLKPVSHSQGWRPILKPVKVKPVQLLPARKPGFHNNGWRPMVPANVPMPTKLHTKPWKEGWPENKPSISLLPPISASGQHEVQIKPTVSVNTGVEVRPVVAVKPALEPPVISFQPVPQVPNFSFQPTNTILPLQPVIPQTHPVVFPNNVHPLLPLQPPVFHLDKPHLPVLPFGASFPAEVLQQSGVVHNKPVFPLPTLPVQPAHPAVPSHPIQPYIPTHPIFSQPHPIHPVYPQHIPHLQPQPVAVPLQPAHPVVSASQPFHPSPLAPHHPHVPGPSAVEFHGKTAHLIPLNRPIFGLPQVPLQQAFPHLVPQMAHQPHGYGFHQLPQGHFNQHLPDTHVQPALPQSHLNPQLPDTHFNPQLPQGKYNPQSPNTHLIPTHINPQSPHIHFNPEGHFNPQFHFDPHVQDGRVSPAFPYQPDTHFNPGVQAPQEHFYPDIPPQPNFTPSQQIPQSHFSPEIPQFPQGHANPEFHHQFPQPQEPAQPQFSIQPSFPEIPQNVLPPHHGLPNGRFPSLNLDPAENLPDVSHNEFPQPQGFPFQPEDPNQPQQPPPHNFGIQPGQTDLQIPFHLPNHPNFRQNDVNVFQQNPAENPNVNDAGNSPEGVDAPFNGYVKK